MGGAPMDLETDEERTPMAHRKETSTSVQSNRSTQHPAAAIDATSLPVGFDLRIALIFSCKISLSPFD